MHREMLGICSQCGDWKFLERRGLVLMLAASIAPALHVVTHGCIPGAQAEGADAELVLLGEVSSVVTWMDSGRPLPVALTTPTHHRPSSPGS